jgi:hypothetical protein
MAVVWVVAPCSLVEVYQRFRGPCYPDDGGSKDLWNVGKLLPDYTVLQPRTQQSSEWNAIKFSNVPGQLSQFRVWLRIWQPEFYPRQGQRIFLQAFASRPALGPSQPPIQWVPGVLSLGVKRGRSVTLTTPRHLMPRPEWVELYLLSPKRLYGV